MLLSCSYVDGGSFLAIPISSSETQIFALRRGKLLENEKENPWSQAQQNMVAKVEPYASELIIPERLLVLPGVSHFGHLIGDGIGIMIATCRKKIPSTLNAKILLVNPPKSFLRLLEVFEIITHFRVEHIEKPAYIRSIQGVYLLSSIVNGVGLVHGSLAMASELVSIYFRKKYNRAMTEVNGQKKIFLTAGTASRISNSADVCQAAARNGWTMLNPLNCDVIETLEQVATAKKLVSENGSILFNCFLARHKPYTVIASPRISIRIPEWIQGGYDYNSFHQSVISYHYAKLDQPSLKHPYADQLLLGLCDIASVFTEK